MSKKNLPILPTATEIPFPGFSIALNVGRKSTALAITNALENNDSEILVTPLKNENSDPQLDNLENFGILCKISQISQPSVGGTLKVILVGLKRVKLEHIEDNLFFSASFSVVEDFEEDKAKVNKLKVKLINLFKEKSKNISVPIDEAEISVFFNSSASQISDAFAFSFPLPYTFKKFFLSNLNIELRLSKLIEIIEKSSSTEEEAEINRKLNERVKTKLTKQQREYYLKEQLKAIQEELSEINGDEGEVGELLKRVNNNPYPPHIKEKLLKEIKRFEMTPSQSAESNIIRVYIDWLISLPYWQHTKDTIDIQKAKKILDKDHYGLDKPKQKIIEYIALKQQNPDSKGAIIALVGPPGTGKTTIAKSIADALGKKFIKISLGGVRDESEIRGHRRTYVAAMPGKIIQAMRKAEVNNPILLLDEIDKMSSDFKGDPTSAMLEVLDYEQNQHFQDHFLEEDYDLSNVTFIATANYVKQIPEALYDRLDIITISSYTELEKIEIAKRHLIPGILKETKVSASNFTFSDDILKYLINYYTMEAGVRQLKRLLQEIARKIIVLKLDGKIKKNFTLNQKMITSLMGMKKFDFSKRSDGPQIGTVTGLAWTQYGGDILPIEVIIYPGTGKLKITGQLKEVMSESANIALSYVKAHAHEFGIPDEIDGKKTFKEYDIHVHSPDGATPKDGPSAGVTFTTALISALSKKPISPFLGMTGEITLRGKVFPIGGLKEKSISAYRSGLKRIYIPKENIKDLEEIPDEVKDNLDIIPFDDYKDLFKAAFKFH